MRRIMVLCSLIMTWLGACVAATPAPEPPDPGQVAMTLFADKVAAEATQAVVDMRYTATAQIVQATATQQAAFVQATGTQQGKLDAQATAQRAREDAQATDQQRRADVQATQARLDAQATADRVHMNVVGTATAQMQATWVAATLDVMPLHDQWTQQAIAVRQTLTADDVEMSYLKVKQQRDTNVLQWLVPFLIAIVGTGVIALYVVRRSRVREVTNDETGVVEALVLDNRQVIKPQLLTGPVLDLVPDVRVPILADLETQNQVTRRAQAVEALRAMPTQAPTANAAAMANGVFGETRKPVVEVLPPGQISQVILDEMGDQVVEEE